MATAFLQQLGVKTALGEKVITENGIYSAEADELDGYSKVEVNVDTEAAFNAGKQAEYDAFWDTYQDNGNRTNYERGFAGTGWNDDTFIPKYSIRPINANGMFSYSKITNLKELLKKHGVELDFSQVSYNRIVQAFAESAITDIGVLDVSSVKEISYLLWNARNLVNVDKVIFSNDGKTTFANNVFQNCSKLSEIRFEGVIGQNGFNVGNCPLLSHDSLMSIINALEDKAFSTKISGSWKFNDSWVGDCYTIERNLNYSVEGDEHAFNIIYIYSPIIAQAVFDEEVQGSISYVVDLNGKTVDFGTTPQTISKQAAEWIAQNATSQGGTITTETGTVWTVTLGTTNLAKLTDAEKAIATQKGWTLA